MDNQQLTGLMVFVAFIAFLAGLFMFAIKHFVAKRLRKPLPSNSPMTRIRELLQHHGICIDCGQMYSHNIDEPFASCGCHQAEWYQLTPYMKLEEKIYLARTEILPPLPASEHKLGTTDELAFTWTQMQEMSSTTRQWIVRHLENKVATGFEGPPGGCLATLNPQGQPGLSANQVLLTDGRGHSDGKLTKS